jgi:hypothetical protein
MRSTHFSTICYTEGASLGLAPEKRHALKRLSPGYAKSKEKAINYEKNIQPEKPVTLPRIDQQHRCQESEPTTIKIDCSVKAFSWSIKEITWNKIYQNREELPAAVLSWSRE